ncbi:MAG TPA: amidase [Noviherbaspirillum sp.]|nr:amidase [Noviherbaspirillum sp.]
MIEPSALDAEGLGAVIAQGLISPSDTILALAERSREVNEVLNCFAYLDEQPALAHARRLEARRLEAWESGSLWGVPYGHKDVFATPSRLPVAGTRVAPLPLSSECASAIASLEREDAIALGALSLDEISYGATGLNAHYGNCRNPWGPGFISGGSSSGAAAAVAARALPFAVCSDTAGSTRIPASICGVVGFKPTFGRIKTSGMVPLSPSQDTIGIVTRSVRDCALVMDAMSQGPERGHEASCHLSAPLNAWLENRALLEGLRVGVCEHPFFSMEIPDGDALLQRAFQALQRLGVRIDRKPLDGLEDCDAAAAVITWTEVLKSYGAYLRTNPDGFTAATRIRLETALAPSEEDYATAQAYRSTALARFVETAFSDADLLVAPTVTIATPTIAKLHADPQESVRTTTSFLRSNRCFSYLGLPALSVPVGFSAHGLPVGLQIIGKPWKDAEVLLLGAAYQSISDWHLMAPKINCARKGHEK